MTMQVNAGVYQPLLDIQNQQVNQNQPAQALRAAPVPAALQALLPPGQVQGAPIQHVQVGQMQGQAAPGREGLLARVGVWLKRAFTGLPHGVPAQMQVNVNGQETTISGARIKSMITALPKATREQALAALPALLNQRLNHGQNLLSTVLNATHNGQATSADVADMMLFLHVRSEAEGHGFSAGAFSVEDPDGRLYDFLNSCPEKYLRSSSHMENDQGAMVGNPQHTNAHRGIDIPPSTHGLLDDSSTVLFAVIPSRGVPQAQLDQAGQAGQAEQPEQAGQARQEQRLFFKSESHGCRLSTLSSAARREGADGFAERNVNFSSDFKNMIGHAFSFIGTRGTGSAAGSHKERIPDSVKNSLKDLCKKINENTTLPQNLRATLLNQLQQDSPLDNAHGVRSVSTNLRQVVASLREIPEAQHLVREQALSLLQPLLTALHKVGQQSHFDARIGNEIMVDSVDIQTPPHAQVTDELALERFLLNNANLNLPLPLVAPGLRLAAAL